MQEREKGRFLTIFFLNKRGNKPVSQLSTWFSSQDAAELGHIKRGVKCVLGSAGQGRVKAGMVDSGARLWDPPGLYVPPFSREVGPKLPPCCAQRKHSMNTVPRISSPPAAHTRT